MNNKTISQLKQRARELKRETGISHYEALNTIACDNGTVDWAQLMRHIAATRTVVQTLSIPRSWSHSFHRIAIEGLEFCGTVGIDGPHIIGPNNLSGVALGVCSLVQFERDEPTYRAHAGEWWICKYSSEARVNITKLTPAGRRALSVEFGIAEGVSRGDDGGRGFLRSPAFQALVNWVRLHPRISRTLASHGSPYIPHWYEQARDALAKEPPKPR